MAESKYKLTYFNVKGIAEFIRYIFAYADVDFEDFRIKKNDWPALKEKQPYGTLPVLEVDGKVLNQSVSIARFLGKRFGLVAEDAFTEALLEAVIDNIRDAQNKIMEIYKKDSAAAEHDHAKLIKDSEEVLKYVLDKLEPLAAEGYLYGKTPTWVDIYFTGIFDTMNDHIPNVLRNHPNLLGICNKIKSKDAVQRYIKNMPIPEPHK